ncbi:CBD9-like protein [Xylariaceae sp. FL0804]|nr:CBD9-like protein [Xylariaceae sp. FL0804]
MPSTSRIATAVVAAAGLLRTGLAQNPTMYTDPATGIEFGTWPQAGNQTIGMALPADALTKNATEYIGLLQCQTGWCGLSHGQSGQMTNALLLMAWASGDQVLTSFRYTAGYTMPGVYTGGGANLTQIASNVTSDGFELLYRCIGCFSWDQDGTAGSDATTAGSLVLGVASSASAPENPDCPAEISFTEHTSFGQFGAPLANVTSDKYAAWAALANTTVTGSC